jgi:hypothetical protein
MSVTWLLFFELLKKESELWSFMREFLGPECMPPFTALTTLIEQVLIINFF